jgi:putative endonuclease
MRGGWVYIVTNRPFGVIYVGVTSNLARRVWEHRERLYPGFAQRYHLVRLVFAERHEEITTAIQRETSIKRWPRAWKLDLIATQNPDWEDLYGQLL